MLKHVQAGQTFNVVGTLAAGETLIGLAGHPGAVIGTGKAPTNDGTIILDGSSKPKASGATLRDTGVLTNAGVISVGGGTNSTHAALLDVVRALNNTGYIDAAAGTGGVGGQVRIETAGTLTNSGTLLLKDGTTSGSSGAVLIDIGVLTNAAGGVINIDAESNYTPGGAATLLVSGVLQNSGMITVGGSGDYLGDRNGNALLVDSGTLTNSGVIVVDAFNSGFGGGLNCTLDVSGTLANQGEIVLLNGQGFSQYSYSAPGGLLLDSGVLDNSGTILLLGNNGSRETGGSIAATGVLTNTGTILVQRAADVTVSGTATSAGSITLYGGASSQYTFYYPGVGGVLAVTGAMTNSGTITMGGGISGGYNYSNGAFPHGGYGAELAVTGTMINTGVLAVGGGDGSVSGFGHTADAYMGTGATISLLGSMFNTGTIELQAATTSSYGLYGTGGALIDNGVLESGSGSLMTIDGGPGAAAGTLTIGASGTWFLDAGSIAGTGVLVNQGTISVNYFSDANTGGVTLANDGLFVADSLGAVVINGAVTADAGKTGLFALNSGTLDFGGAVAASQTIAFFSQEHNTLALGDTSQFGGTLSGLSASSVIDFLKLDVTSATTAGDILAIGLLSGATLDLALAAPLVGVSLNLQRDGNHGTDLVLTPSPQGHF